MRWDRGEMSDTPKDAWERACAMAACGQFSLRSAGIGWEAQWMTDDTYDESERPPELLIEWRATTQEDAVNALWERVKLLIGQE